jgi:hypothetical protein
VPALPSLSEPADRNRSSVERGDHLIGPRLLREPRYRNLPPA